MSYTLWKNYKLLVKTCIKPTFSISLETAIKQLVVSTYFEKQKATSRIQGASNTVLKSNMHILDATLKSNTHILDVLFIQKLIHKDKAFPACKKLICTIGTNVIFLEKKLDKHTLRMVYGGWLLTGGREGRGGNSGPSMPKTVKCHMR